MKDLDAKTYYITVLDADNAKEVKFGLMITEPKMLNFEIEKRVYQAIKALEKTQKGEKTYLTP